MVHPTIYLKRKTIQYSLSILKPSQATFALGLLAQASPSWTRLRAGKGSPSWENRNNHNKLVTTRFGLRLGNKHHLQQS